MLFRSTAAALTITTRPTLTITANSPSAITYGASTPANGYSSSGLAANDVISGLTYTYAGSGSTTYAASTTAPTLPGTYSITPSALTFSTGASSNYTSIAYVAGSFTINSAVLAITANSPSAITYGASTPANGYTTTEIGRAHV